MEQKVKEKMWIRVKKHRRWRKFNVYVIIDPAGKEGNVEKKQYLKYLQQYLKKMTKKWWKGTTHRSNNLNKSQAKKKQKEIHTWLYKNEMHNMKNIL